MNRLSQTILTIILLILSSTALLSCDFIKKINAIDTDMDWFDWKRSYDKKQLRKDGSVNEARLVQIIRADLLKLNVNGEDHTVHLYNIVSPSPSDTTFNYKLQKRLETDNRRLMTEGRTAVDYVQGLLSTSRLLWVTFETTTNKDGRVEKEGDLFYIHTRSLARDLLLQGYAIIYTNASKYYTLYQAIEEDARKNERGIWAHPVPFNKRFYITSRFEEETLSTDTQKVYGDTSKGRNLLETHRIQERRGKIDVSIQIQKPVVRPYEGMIKYRFYYKDIFGINASRGEPVKPGSHSIMPLYLQSVYTNFPIYSGITIYTESTKAGRGYSHGNTVVGYDMEVWMGTNLVYSYDDSR